MAARSVPTDSALRGTGAEEGNLALRQKVRLLRNTGFFIGLGRTVRV